MVDKSKSNLGSTTQLAPEPSITRLGTSWPVALLIFHGHKARLATIANHQRLVLGRDPEADIPVLDERLSRLHAAFEAIDGEVWVSDLGSTNGTKVNGQPLSRARLAPGDEVRMGSVRASIHLRATAPGGPVESHERFLRAIEREAQRARAFGRSFALLTVKRVVGPAGAEPWQALRRQLRAVDSVAPYSGEVRELLLAEADLADAQRIAAAIVAAGPYRCGIALYPALAAGELIRASLAALRRTSAEAPVQLAASSGSAGAAVSAEPRECVVQNPAMRELHASVARLASAQIPVLLVGETGSGKEVLARALHEKGKRASGPMASINCAAIPSTLVESVLFGHVKGAFTGAVVDSPGIFEEADGGTAFLDEIGELPAAAQAALLRVLETKRVRRVGSNKEIAVDVRVVAATHRDLAAMCAEGTFRQDLLYRINTMVLQIPPLRQRPEEIATLAELFLAQANAANGAAIEGIDREAMLALHQHSWPGNVRELRNVIERAVVIASASWIGLVDLPEALRSLGTPQGADEASSRRGQPLSGSPSDAAPYGPGASAQHQDGADFKACMEQAEVAILLGALERAGGNRKEAAALLQMPLRTFSHKLSQHGIRAKGFVAGQ